MLSDFVVWRRSAASQGLAAAAQEGATGGTVLQELPEFMLPYVVQVGWGCCQGSGSKIRVAVVLSDCQKTPAF
jgi:hypothetical protein